MVLYYISTDTNKVGEVEVDEQNGSLVKMTMYPVAPNPDNVSDGSVATQWMVQHPSHNLLLALTSYGNKRPAQLNLFEKGDKSSGLTKLTVEASTAGREAVHAVFAPSTGADKVTMAVSHHNDGFVSFFQLDSDKVPESLMDQPAVTLELPILEGNNKNVLASSANKYTFSTPACHHILYEKGGKYCLIVDSSQSVIFTYKVDPATGLPDPEESPTSQFICHTDAHALGWFSGLLDKFVCKGRCRPRRVAICPNGQYVFVSYEFRNVIQVYALDSATGTIDPDKKGCLQEVSTLDKHLTDEGFIGLTVQASSEMVVVGQSLYVSNRGMAAKAGKALGRSENTVRIWDIKDGGRLASQHAVTCKGPVRHFCVYESGEYEILVAGTQEPGGSLQTFRRRKRNEDASENEVSDKYQLVGDANVGVNVWCVLPAAAAAATASESGGVEESKDE